MMQSTEDVNKFQTEIVEKSLLKLVFRVEKILCASIFELLILRRCP